MTVIDDLLEGFAEMFADGLGSPRPKKIALEKVSDAEALNHVFVQIPATGRSSATVSDDIAFTISDIHSWDYKPVYRLIDACIAARDLVIGELEGHGRDLESKTHGPDPKLQNHGLTATEAIRQLESLIDKHAAWMDKTSRRRMYEIAVQAAWRKS